MHVQSTSRAGGGGTGVPLRERGMLKSYRTHMQEVYGKRTVCACNHLRKRVFVCDIVYQHRALALTVVDGPQRMKPLLPRRILRHPRYGRRLGYIKGTAQRICTHTFAFDTGSSRVCSECAGCPHGRFRQAAKHRNCSLRVTATATNAVATITTTTTTTCTCTATHPNIEVHSLALQVHPLLQERSLPTESGGQAAVKQKVCGVQRVCAIFF